MNKQERLQLIKEVQNLPKCCTCQTCTSLLESDTPGLEIWYGTGSNGKSTLMKYLCLEVGAENVAHVPYIPIGVSRADIRIHEQINKDNIALVVIQEPSYPGELDSLVHAYNVYGDNRKRFVIITNHLPKTVSDQCRIVHFTHKF